MTPLRQGTLAALLGACLALCAARVHAEEAPDASLKSPTWLAPHGTSVKPAKPLAGGATLGLGRSVGVLLLAGLLGGTALYLRSKKNKAPKARLAQLRVVGSTKLGGRAQLVLAEVDGRKILLGVTDASVRKLGWLDAAPAEEEEDSVSSARPRLVASGVELAARVSRAVEPARAAAPSPTPAPKRSFRDLLASAVGNIGHRPDDDSAALTLAAETQDTFTRSTPRAAASLRAEPARQKGNPQMLDVEGQAKGLLARLGEPRQ